MCVFMSLYKLSFHIIKIMEGILGTVLDFLISLLDLRSRFTHPARMRFMKSQCIRLQFCVADEHTETGGRARLYTPKFPCL